MEEIVVGIDVGTTKVCTLVGRVEGEKSIRIIGVGIEPSDGIRKGVIVDLATATQAIKHSVERAEQTSGLEITSALVSLAGGHVSSINSRGAVAVPGGIIDASDVARALDQARAIAIPHDREIVHIIQRGFSVDGQEGTRAPLGMHGSRLEVEAHIITAAAATVDNLRQCVSAVGRGSPGLCVKSACICRGRPDGTGTTDGRGGLRYRRRNHRPGNLRG